MPVVCLTGRSWKTVLFFSIKRCTGDMIMLNSYQFRETFYKVTNTGFRGRTHENH